MAGAGPAPKDPDKRARQGTNARRVNGKADPLGAQRTVPLIRGTAPELPADLLPAGIDWHPQTRRWWDAWVRSPLSRDFTEVEWQEMLATAVLYHEFYSGTRGLAGEIRLRMAKVGATSEDRARLRIVMADADAKDDAKPAKSNPARDRYANVRAMAAPPVQDVG